MITFKTSRKQLDKLFEDLDDHILDQVNVFAEDLYEDIRENTPVDTGQARRGWELERANKTSRNAQVGNDVEHVKYLEFGTANIEPRRFIQRSIKQLLNRN